MWMYLDKEDRDYLVNAFKEDGFKVNPQSTELVAEKNGQKIVVKDPQDAQIIWDMKKTFEEQGLLASKIGGIPSDSIFDFLKKEKKEKETLFETFKRIHTKFNWAFGVQGEQDLDYEWKSQGEKVFYAVLYTDEKQDSQKNLMIVSFKSKKGEKIYFIEMGYLPFIRFLNQYSPLQGFMDLAPSAYIKLKAYSK